MTTRNIGTRDRDIRIALGVALLIAAIFALPGVWAVAVGALGLVLLGTAAIGFCPLYLPLHINTREGHEAHR